MKTRVLSACAFVAALSTAAFVTAEPSVVYNDAVNDVASGIYNPSGILDLASMEVSNDATDITFKLTINGSGFSPRESRELAESDIGKVRDVLPIVC